MNWATVENADYFIDMETIIRDRKRGWGGEARYVPNSDRYDEDIVSFLEGLEEFWEQKFKGEEEEDDDDPSYMDFLGNIKEHGNAYMCDVSVEHGVLSRIVYEEDDDIVPVKRKIPTSRGGACSREKKKVGDDWRSNLEISSAPQNGSRDKYQRSSDLNSSNAWNNHSDGVKGKIPSSGRGDFLRERRSLHVHDDQRSGPVCSSFGERVSEEVDTKYKEFLDNLYVIDGSVFYEYGDNKRILYESSDQQTTDVEIEPLQTDIRSPASTRRPARKTSKLRPLISTLEPSTSMPRTTTPPSREQITTQRRATTTNNNMLSTSTCKNEENPRERFSSFWKELHEYLRKPYKQTEFDDLMQHVSFRRRVSIYRDSRSGGSERPGELGKSYLQHFPDLNVEIKKVESDRYKVLNLLRMFAVYVQKIPSGVPRPWMDDFSKTIMPGSK